MKHTTTYTILLVLLIISFNLQAQEAHSCHGHDHAAVQEEQAPTAKLVSTNLTIPNAQLVNQKGEAVEFSELIKGKVVAMNFIFTTCTTICPPMGANFANLKGMMADKVASGELLMLSISIDPATDTPERLLHWSNKFEAGDGWTLLTGEKGTVDDLLKSLKVFTPLKEEHAPILMMGKAGERNWVRTNGLAPAAQIKEKLEGYFTETEAINHEENYFTNVKLTNQYGEEMRLYQDLMKDKVVVVVPFFLRCQATCPVMSAMMKDLQEYYGDRIGKEVHLLSISVDPTHDTPARVKEYAEAMGAKKGWYLLTGSKENVAQALHKLGNGVKEPSDHKNIVMIGNVSTRLWKKANGLASSEEIAKIVDTVLRDEE